MKRYSFMMPVLIFVMGGAFGVLSKILDIYTQNLGNIFSQMSIWILLGSLIAIFSKTKGKAALNVFVFCIGMLITYYITAELTNSVYGLTFIYGWAAFSVCSPVFALLTWMTKEKELLARLYPLASWSLHWPFLWWYLMDRECMTS